MHRVCVCALLRVLPILHIARSLYFPYQAHACTEAKHQHHLLYAYICPCRLPHAPTASLAWIAGPVIGGVAGVVGIAVLTVVIKKKRARQGLERVAPRNEPPV